MSVSDSQILDLVEEATGVRKMVLTAPEFARLVGQHQVNIRRRLGQDIPAYREGDQGRWRIPVTSLRPFLEGEVAA